MSESSPKDPRQSESNAEKKNLMQLRQVVIELFEKHGAEITESDLDDFPTLGDIIGYGRILLGADKFTDVIVKYGDPELAAWALHDADGLSEEHVGRITQLVIDKKAQEPAEYIRSHGIALNPTQKKEIEQLAKKN